MLKFNKTYFFLTLLLFVIEVYIALYINDRIIRPYVGDILVVILLYCFIKTFLELKVRVVIAFVLVFSFGIETLQYLKVVEKLGLEHFRLARVVIGTSFEWMDLLCYVFGLFIVLLAEKIGRKKQ